MAVELDMKVHGGAYQKERAPTEAAASSVRCLEFVSKVRRPPTRSEGWGRIWWLLAYRQTSIGMPRANGRLRRAPLAFRGISRALTCYDGNAINTNTKLTLVVLIVFFLALALAALWML